MAILRSDLLTNKYTIISHEDNFRFNAPCHFVISSVKTGEELARVDFQEGPIKGSGVNGACNEDLIGMVIRRLEAFQDSPFKGSENAMAIVKLQEALMWLRKRTRGREARGVEGTHVV